MAEIINLRGVAIEIPVEDEAYAENVTRDSSNFYPDTSGLYQGILFGVIEYDASIRPEGQVADEYAEGQETTALILASRADALAYREGLNPLNVITGTMIGFRYRQQQAEVGANV